MITDGDKRELEVLRADNKEYLRLLDALLDEDKLSELADKFRRYPRESNLNILLTVIPELAPIATLRAMLDAEA